MNVTHVLLTDTDGAVVCGQMFTEDGVSPSMDEVTAWVATAGFAGRPWRLYNPEDLPADRSFRKAWRDNGRAVRVEMKAAAEIQKDRLRALRAPLLEALDREQMRAFGQNDAAAVAAVEARKQALRDVTAAPEIAAAKTPEELLAVVPDVLKV